jgi:predicted nucleic acid-binding protein
MATAAAPTRSACVVDTSIWIGWLVGSALGKRLAKQIPEKSDCFVPTIVQLELAKWLTREVSEDESDRVIAYMQKCVVVPLDTELALLAAELHRSHKLATADAIVYATARTRGIPLLTSDTHFDGLPDVILFAKK